MKQRHDLASDRDAARSGRGKRTAAPTSSARPRMPSSSSIAFMRLAMEFGVIYTNSLGRRFLPMRVVALEPGFRWSSP